MVNSSYGKPTVYTQPKKDDFKYEEESIAGKLVYTYYGFKGVGKTTAAFHHEGNLLCLSLDRKAQRIKKTLFKDDPRIHVFDAIKYWSHEKDKLTESSNKTYDYIKFILNTSKDKDIDWIIFDCAGTLAYICEQKMRYDNNLKPFQGFPNLNLWKDRNLNLRALHNIAINLAKKGVIYTTFTTKDDIVVKGTLMTRKDIPRWNDAIMEETDFVVKLYQERNKEDILTNFAEITTSKDDSMHKTAEKIDISGNKSIFKRT